MRDDLRRAASRLWGDAARKAAKGPSGPVIVTKPGRRPLHSYRDAGAFERALEDKHGDQRVTCILQVSYAEPRYSEELGGHYRREDEWIDAEVFEGPFRWGGVLDKDVGSDGKPALRGPDRRELLACAARHGAKAARAVFRTDVGPAFRDPVTGKQGNSDPVTSPVVKAIYGAKTNGKGE